MLFRSFCFPVTILEQNERRTNKQRDSRPREKPKIPKRRNRSKRNSENHGHSTKSNGRIKPSNDGNRNKKRDKRCNNRKHDKNVTNLEVQIALGIAKTKETNKNIDAISEQLEALKKDVITRRITADAAKENAKTLGERLVKEMEVKGTNKQRVS